jgi:uncharacterized DUF497 family protein
VHTLWRIEYEWDPRKAAQNFRKHGVDYTDAVIALEDENALTIEDTAQNEARFKTLGMGRHRISCWSFIVSGMKI